MTGGTVDALTGPAAALRVGDLAGRADRARLRHGVPFSPWPAPASVPARDWAHAGVRTALHSGGGSAADRSALVGAGVFAPDGGPGTWSVSGHRGLLAVQDLGVDDPQVWIGADSLRFSVFLADRCPRGAALDVGAGSGISGCRLAASCGTVTSIDIVPEAVSAVRLAARLNGCADSVRPIRLSLQDACRGGLPTGAFKVVAANLPGVPVPTGVAYSPAGDGGPDGLLLARELLAGLPRLVDADGATLLMRFQSLADDGDLLLGRHVRDLCDRHRWDAMIVVDQQVPASVRAAVTTRYAAERAPERGLAELLAANDEHLRRLAADTYVSGNLELHTHGSGQVRCVRPRRGHHDVWRSVRALRHNERAAVLMAFGNACQDLPDEFWELADAGDLHRLADRVGDVLDVLVEPCSTPDVAAALSPAGDDPLRTRAVGLAVAVLLPVLELHGLARCTSPG